MSEERDNAAERSAPPSEPLKKERKIRKIPPVWTAVIIVAAVALAAGGVYFSATFTPPAPEAPEYVDKSMSQGKKREDVKSVTVTTSEGTLVVERDAEGVYFVRDSSAPINQTKGNDIFYTASFGLAYEEIVEAHPKDLSIYGLDPPVSTAVVAYNDGTSRVFLVGDRTPIGSTYYFMEKDGDTVYTVWSNHGTNMSVTMPDLYQAQLPAPNVENLQRVSVQREEGESIELTNVGGLDTTLTIAVWRMASPYEVDCDWEKSNAYATAAASLTLKRFVAEATDFAQYGLDHPRARVSVADKDGVSYDVEIGGAAASGEVYARVTGSNEVFVMDSKLVSFLDTTALSMIDRFLNIIKIDVIDALTLNIPGKGEQKFTIVRKPEFNDKGERVINAGGDPTYVETFFLNGEEIQEKAFKTYYQIIIGRLVDGVVDKPLPGGDPVLTVTFHLRDNKGEVASAYLPYDVNFYAYLRDGAEPMFVTRAERVREMLDGFDKLVAGEYNEK